MDFSLPRSTEKLGNARVEFLQAFRTSCAQTILQMLRTSQSGHPGGSLSCLDYLTLLYAFRLTQTNEKIVVSNGHISPGVYSVLAECGVIDHDEVIQNFRQIGSVYEGHVTRHIPGIHFGTGPLGVGTSAAAGFAWSEKQLGKDTKVFGLLGDGEAQEGQVHEMALFGAKAGLDNLIMFCDYNQVQLSDSLEAVLPINISGMFKAHGWNVYEVDGHDFEALWETLNKACQSDKPVMIVGHTIMGKGVPLMEPDGIAYKASWHGKAPKPDVIDEQIQLLALDQSQIQSLKDFRKDRSFDPGKNPWSDNLKPMRDVNTGSPIEYDAETLTDCRSAYGKALLDLAQNNNNIIGSTADLGGSVMTKFVKAELPDQHIEFGICEQNMVSTCGSISLNGFIPFCSTFGAFMSSRAKDQARVNDINGTNVKMVSTHCGLSVGEDGPTHQSIDDMGSFLGMLNTHVCEPADPNHCDRIIRYAAAHYGNFYVRMGRHKLPTLLKEDGSIFYDKDYQYEYGKCDLYRQGDAVTIVASGPMVDEAQRAATESNIKADIVICSSPKKFDNTLKSSLQKTGKVIVVEDHNGLSGFASQVALYAAENSIALKKFIDISPQEYQLSGKPAELYDSAQIGAQNIAEALRNL